MTEALPEKHLRTMCAEIEDRRRFMLNRTPKSLQSG